MPHISVTAQTTPDKPAIIMAGSGETVTYRQLDERSNQVAHLFRALGLDEGDVEGLRALDATRILRAQAERALAAAGESVGEAPTLEDLVRGSLKMLVKR